MATNRIAIREGGRQARRQATRLGEELAALRLRAGLTQTAVGRAVGMDRSVISRLERRDPQVGLPIRFCVAALLGAELRLSAYPNSGPLIRDAAQARIVESVLARVDPRWKRTPEASVPGSDRRSIDLRLDGPAGVILCEVESRVGSLEEIIRELHSKRSAVQLTTRQPVRAVLVLPRTRHHLDIGRHHPRTIEAALADASQPWTGDGILWTRVVARLPSGGPKGIP